MVRKINSLPDEFGHYGWAHTCKGGETCMECGGKATPGAQAIFYSGFDQDFLYCPKCAELEGVR